MKKNSFALCLLIALASFSNVFAGQRNEKMYKGEQSHSNGFAISAVAGDAPLAVIGYYFGENNCAGVFAGVTPYASQNNVAGIQNNSNWTTSFFVSPAYFLPLAREKLSNKLFLRNDFAYSMLFGQNPTDNTKIKSSWNVAWLMGFEYRFNPNIYLSIFGTMLGYGESKYANPTSPFPEITKSTQWNWNILNGACISLTYKI